jgi:uncharacterized protein involved in exopolysaccharide biosynthesis
MNTNDNNKNLKDFELFDIFIFLFKNRKSIIIITLIGIIASVIASYVVKNEYKSTVVLYPSQNISYSRVILNDISNSNDIFQFGGEKDTEKMLQILESNDIKNQLIKKLDLYNHYEIDSGSENSLTLIYNEIGSRIDFKKTEFDAISISVTDRSPETAAKIAGEIADIVDSAMYEIKYQQSLNVYKYLQTQYDEILNNIIVLDDSLQKIKENGVLDYYIEVERYTEALAKGYANNTITNSAKDFFNKKFELLSTQSGEFNLIKDMISDEKNKLFKVRDRIIQMKANFNKDMVSVFVIEKPEISYKKVKPVRWLIVTLSTIGAFSFSIFALLLIEFLKQFKKKLNENL